MNTNAILNEEIKITRKENCFRVGMIDRVARSILLLETILQDSEEMEEGMKDWLDDELDTLLHLMWRHFQNKEGITFKAFKDKYIEERLKQS